MWGQYKPPLFNYTSDILETLPVTGSTFIYGVAWPLQPSFSYWGPQQTGSPRKTSSAFGKHLNVTKPCLWRYQGRVLTSQHATAWRKNGEFTLDFLKRSFSEGRASGFLISVLPWPPKPDVPPEYSHRPGLLFQAQDWGPQSISWFSICLWQRKHQADTSQSGISCFPAFDLLSWGCLSSLGLCCGSDRSRGLLVSTPRPIVVIVFEEGDHLSKWLVTTPPWLREAFLIRADDNESLIEWLTTSTDLEVLMTPLP